MNFYKIYIMRTNRYDQYIEAFKKAIELAENSVRCKLYKENGVWVVEPN